MGRKKNWAISALLLIPAVLLLSMQGAVAEQGGDVIDVMVEEPTPVPDDNPVPLPPDGDAQGTEIDWARVTMPGPAQMTNSPAIGDPVYIQEASPEQKPQSMPPALANGGVEPPSPELAPAPVPVPNPGEGEQEPTAAPVPETGSATTYVVQRGDTLYSISLRFGVAQGDLAAANNITWWDYIYAGDEMIIPGDGYSDDTPASTSAAEAPVVEQAPEPAAQTNNGQPSSTNDAAILSGPTTYVVQHGDSLGSISWRFAVDMGALIAANNITNPNYIWYGQVLVIPAGGAALTEGTVAAQATESEPAQNTSQPAAAAPVETSVSTAEPDDNAVYTVQRGDSLVQIARKFGVDVMSLINTNNIVNANYIYAGQQIVIPHLTEEQAQAVAAAAEEAAEVTIVEATDPSQYERFIWPVENFRIVRWFAYWHPGIDLVIDVGTPVVAAAAGEVEFSGWNEYGYGYAVIIDHGGGVRTLYAHNSELLVSQGDQVEQGATIALSGSTGWSNWPHVHLELIYYDRIRQNPCDYMPGGCG